MSISFFFFSKRKRKASCQTFSKSRCAYKASYGKNLRIARKGTSLPTDSQVTVVPKPTLDPQEIEKYFHRVRGLVKISFFRAEEEGIHGNSNSCSLKAGVGNEASAGLFYSHSIGNSTFFLVWNTSLLNNTKSCYFKAGRNGYKTVSKAI